MNRTRTFEELQATLKGFDLDLTQPKFRYIIEYDDHVDPWVFENLDEVTAFVEGIEYAKVWL